MIRILSQLRESDLPVGDASRTLPSSSGLLEVLPIYRLLVDYIGSKSVLSQLRESDLPVGDANRTLCSSSGLLELLPIYRSRSTILGVKELVNTPPSSVC